MNERAQKIAEAIRQDYMSRDSDWWNGEPNPGRVPICAINGYSPMLVHDARILVLALAAKLLPGEHVEPDAFKQDFKIAVASFARQVPPSELRQFSTRDMLKKLINETQSEFTGDWLRYG